MDTTIRQWEALPWQDRDYPGLANEPLLARARRCAELRWRGIAAREPEVRSAHPLRGYDPLPPGIPDWERALWPERDVDAGPDQIHLDVAYTGMLDSCFYPQWHEGYWGDELSGLSAGLHRFGGVLFDVRGLVWLRPETFYPRDRLYGEACRDYPVRVEGIPVHRTCRTLHVLHAVNNLGYSSKADCQTYALQGLVVASYVFHYADGEEREQEVVYGRDLRHWWQGAAGDPEPEASEADVAWRGSNAAAELSECKLRLFHSAFVNPRPDAEVVSIDFVSKETPLAPFLVAMTVEE